MSISIIRRSNILVKTLSSTASFRFALSAREMIPPVNSLVKYDNPILVASSKGKKDAKTAVPKAPPAATQTEDILNSILPPRCETELTGNLKLGVDVLTCTAAVLPAPNEPTRSALALRACRSPVSALDRSVSQNIVRGRHSHSSIPPQSTLNPMHIADQPVS